MVNFGPLAAEIDSLVWGTPANFNGFRILAALLHGTLAVGASQTLRRRTEGKSDGQHGLCELTSPEPRQKKTTDMKNHACDDIQK